MSDAGAAEKEHEPTQKRLDDARARGEVAQASDLATAAAYAGFLLAAAALGGWSVQRFAATATGILSRADALAADLFSPRPESLGAPVAAMLLPFLPLVAFPAAAVLALLVALRAVVVAPERLTPRWSRLDPLAGLRQRFGRDGLFDFAKSLAKLVLIAAVLWTYLAARLDRVVMAQMQEPGPIMIALSGILLGCLARVLAISLAVGALDHLWQRAALRRRNRMSREELLEEFRQADGDPHLRQARRQRARDIATNRMIADVRKADVVIVNPAHFAVALRWDRGSGLPPVCVAKGVDEVAARIREAAALAAVPVRSDPPTARALYAAVEVGAAIRPEDYRAVAAAIRFAERVRGHARRAR